MYVCMSEQECICFPSDWKLKKKKKGMKQVHVLAG